MAHSMDPLQMLMEGADRLGNAALGAVESLVGFTAQHAPGAIGATINAGVELGTGINDAVRGMAESITPSTPSAPSNPFAGLNLGEALQGLRTCSAGPDTYELGQLAAPLSQMAQVRQSGYSVGM